MLLDTLPEQTKSHHGLVDSVTFRELADLMRFPLPAQARLAAARFRLQHTAASEVLYRSGDPFESLFVVRSGLIDRAVANGGQKQVVGFILTGETAGVDSFQNGKHSVAATPLGPVEVALLPITKLRQLAELAGERELGEQVIRWILIQATAQDNGLLRHPETLGTRTRVGALLLSLGRRFEPVHSIRAPLDFAIPDAEIGSYLGLPPRAVRDVLREFVDAG